MDCSAGAVGAGAVVGAVGVAGVVVSDGVPGVVFDGVVASGGAVGVPGVVFNGAAGLGLGFGVTVSGAILPGESDEGAIGAADPGGVDSVELGFAGSEVAGLSEVVGLEAGEGV